MAQPQNVINLSDAIRGVLRRKILVLTTLVLGALVGLAILILIKPSYQAESQIVVENLATPYDKANTNNINEVATSNPVDDRMVTTQVYSVKSADIAARVVDQLKLSEKKEFNPLLSDIGFVDDLLIALGFSDDPRLMEPKDLAIQRLQKKMVVYAIPESNAFGIKYQARDGQTAAAVANATAEIYVLSTQENAAGSTDRSREWLSQQITDLRGKVSTSEAEVEKYRSEAGLLRGENATLGIQQISELNKQIGDAEAAAIEASARADEIKSLLANKGSVDESSDVLNSPAIQSLRTQQTTAQSKVSELSATYLPNHPKMVAAERELDTVNRQIRREALKVVEGLAGQAKVAAARAQSLRNNLEKMKGRETTANQSDIKLKELERTASTNRSLLEALLVKYADAQARRDLSLQPGFARIIQKASVPASPIFPKPGPIMLLTSLAGLILGLGLAFLLEIMNGSARAANGVLLGPREHPARAALDHELPIPTIPITFSPSRGSSPFDPVVPEMPVPPAPAESHMPLAMLPMVSSLGPALGMAELAATNASSPLNDGAAKIVSQFLELRGQKGIKTFGFTSIGSNGCEASLTVVATARAMAGLKLKVISVDASALQFFDPLFGVPTGPGVSDMVLGDADFKKVICRDPQSNAHLIRYGLKTPAQAQVTILEKLGTIISALATIYDIILINTGEASPSTPALLKECSAAVLLSPATRQKDAVTAARILGEKGVAHTMLVQLNPEMETQERQAAHG
jgi:succinoglycan biosynthesis transport protein ExoP